MSKITTHLSAFVEILKDASQEFSNHGCNDVTLPNTDDNWQLLQDVEAWSLDDCDDRTETRPTDKYLNFSDWILMDYLVHLLKQEHGTK